jgi:hypothetical protein
MDHKPCPTNNLAAPDGVGYHRAGLVPQQKKAGNVRKETMTVKSPWNQALLPLAVVYLFGVNPALQADLLFPVKTVDRGLPLAQPFHFVNQGPADVEINGLRASCGCLKPKLDKRSWKPGEKGSLLLEIHTLGQSAGAHSWQLHVTYRSAAMDRSATLELRGQVVTEITVQPAALTLFTTQRGRHEIVLTDRRQHPLTLTGVHTTCPHLHAQTRPSTDPRVTIVGLDLDGDFPNGRHEEAVILLTDDTMYRELKVPVTVVKRPRQQVMASPPAVKLEAPRGQPLPSRIVLLRPAGEETVQVESISGDDPAISCTWAPGPGNFTTLKIVADHRRIPSSRLNTAIHVHLAKPLQETLTIPVSCNPE